MSSEIILINFEETRRRSLKLWAGIPPAYEFWQPDQHALKCIEMVRHIFESEHAYQKIIENRGSIGNNYASPWENRAYTNIADEIAFAALYRKSFIETVKSFSEQDLVQVRIVRTELGQSRFLADFLLRVAYHESVHAGQLLSYLRTLDIERPQLWD